MCLKLIASQSFSGILVLRIDRSIGNSRSIPPLGVQSQFTWAGSTTFISPSSAPSACYSFPFFPSISFLFPSPSTHGSLFSDALRGPPAVRELPGGGGALPRSGSDALPPLLSAAASMSAAATTGPAARALRGRRGRPAVAPSAGGGLPGGEHRVRSLSSVSSVPSLSSVRGGRGAPLAARRWRGSASGAAQGSRQIQFFFLFFIQFFLKCYLSFFVLDVHFCFFYLINFSLSNFFS